MGRVWSARYAAALLMILLLAACSQEEPEEAIVEEVQAYRIGIFEEPTTLNYWNYLGPGTSVWTQYALDGQAGSLYSLSDQRFDFVPSLAAGLPTDPVQEGDSARATL